MSEKNPLKVHEVAVKYGTSSTDTYQLVSKAQDGISVNAFFDILTISGLSKEELSGLLDVSFKTIQRYQKEEKKLSALNSEQLLKMIGLYQKAENIFGTIESFNSWLRKPAIGIGGKEPLKFMQTSGGIDLLLEELHRIEYGALA
ncbi:MAG: antitoxin Xre/MbcA/ParS toxin-binding domain-containing protein [Balneolaceae bacterium]